MLRNTREIPFGLSWYRYLELQFVVFSFENTASLHFSLQRIPRFYVSSTKFKQQMITVKLVWNCERYNCSYNYFQQTGKILLRIFQCHMFCSRSERRETFQLIVFINSLMRSVHNRCCYGNCSYRYQLYIGEYKGHSVSLRFNMIGEVY